MLKCSLYSHIHVCETYHYHQYHCHPLPLPCILSSNMNEYKNSTSNDICRKHSARSALAAETYQACPSKLSRRELEDLYYNLLNQNLELKQNVNEQKEKIKILSTKLHRASDVHRNSLVKDQNGAINEHLETIADLQRANDKLSERIKQMNMKLCSAKQFLKPVGRCSKCHPTSKNKSTSVLNSKVSDSNLRTTTSSQYLYRDTVSTHTVGTEISDMDAIHLKDGGNQPCSENKCRTQMENLNLKVMDLQEELSRAHREYSQRISWLETEMAKLQSENIHVRAGQQMSDQCVQQRENEMTQLKQKLREIQALISDLELQLSLEKKKSAEFQTQLKAAQLSTDVSKTIEDHLSNTAREQESNYKRSSNAPADNYPTRVLNELPLSLSKTESTKEQDFPQRTSITPQSRYQSDYPDPEYTDKRVSKTGSTKEQDSPQRISITPQSRYQSDYPNPGYTDKRVSKTGSTKEQDSPQRTSITPQSRYQSDYPDPGYTNKRVSKTGSTKEQDSPQRTSITPQSRYQSDYPDPGYTNKRVSKTESAKQQDSPQRTSICPQSCYQSDCVDPGCTDNRVSKPESSNQRASQERRSSVPLQSTYQSDYSEPRDTAKRISKDDSPTKQLSPQIRSSTPAQTTYQSDYTDSGYTDTNRSLASDAEKVNEDLTKRIRVLEDELQQLKIKNNTLQVPENHPSKSRNSFSTEKERGSRYDKNNFNDDEENEESVEKYFSASSFDRKISNRYDDPTNSIENKSTFEEDVGTSKQVNKLVDQIIVDANKQNLKGHDNLSNSNEIAIKNEFFQNENQQGLKIVSGKNFTITNETDVNKSTWNYLKLKMKQGGKTKYNEENITQQTEYNTDIMQTSTETSNQNNIKNYDSDTTNESSRETKRTDTSKNKNVSGKYGNNKTIISPANVSNPLKNNSSTPNKDITSKVENKYSSDYNRRNSKAGGKTNINKSKINPNQKNTETLRNNKPDLDQNGDISTKRNNNTNLNDKKENNTSNPEKEITSNVENKYNGGNVRNISKSEKNGSENPKSEFIQKLTSNSFDNKNSFDQNDIKPVTDINCNGKTCNAECITGPKDNKHENNSLKLIKEIISEVKTKNSDDIDPKISKSDENNSDNSKSEDVRKKALTLRDHKDGLDDKSFNSVKFNNIDCNNKTCVAKCIECSKIENNDQKNYSSKSNREIISEVVKVQCDGRICRKSKCEKRNKTNSYQIHESSSNFDTYSLNPRRVNSFKSVGCNNETCTRECIKFDEDNCQTYTINGNKVPAEKYYIECKNDICMFQNKNLIASPNTRARQPSIVQRNVLQDTNARGTSSPDNTDCEISHMSDLPSEREDPTTSTSKRIKRDLSPGEQYSRSFTTSYFTTTDTSISEGELPPYSGRKLSYGECGVNVNTTRSTESTKQKMESALEAITTELARCRQLLRLKNDREVMYCSAETRVAS